MKYILAFCFAVAIAFCGAFLYFYAQVRFEAYSIIDYKPKLTTQIFDRNNELIANIFEENRIYVRYNDIPARVI